MNEISPYAIPNYVFIPNINAQAFVEENPSKILKLEIGNEMLTDGCQMDRRADVRTLTQTVQTV